MGELRRRPSNDRSATITASLWDFPGEDPRTSPAMKKMGDNGTRPAMNVRFASDADARLIISVDVTSQRSDAGLLHPMYDTVCQQYGVTPDLRTSAPLPATSAGKATARSIRHMTA